MSAIDCSVLPQLDFRRCLVVRDLEGEPGFAGDADRLIDCFQELLAFVADVGHVDAAVLGDDLGERDDLLGAREGSGRVDQAGGEAEGAGGHAVGNVFAHARELSALGSRRFMPSEW